MAYRALVVTLCFSLAGLPLAMAKPQQASGQLLASQRCEAFQSVSKGTNPGNYQLKKGNKYKVLQKNRRKNGNWLRIDLGKVSQGDHKRWVKASCGQWLAKSSATTAVTATGTSCQSVGNFSRYVLAASWQPGFCEHSKSGASKAECKAMARQKLSVNHLTLHGLWPNNPSCGRSYRNCSTEPLQLSSNTLKALEKWMPNTRFTGDDGFARYQWKAHGSCQAGDDDSYFLLAASLVKQLNSGPLGKLLSEYTGQSLATKTFYREAKQHYAIDQQQLQLVCRKGKYLEEIRLALKKPLDSQAPLRGNIDKNGKLLPLNSKERCGSNIYIERSGPA